MRRAARLVDNRATLTDARRDPSHRLGMILANGGKLGVNKE